MDNTEMDKTHICINEKVCMCDGNDSECDSKECEPNDYTLNLMIELYIWPKVATMHIADYNNDVV